MRPLPLLAALAAALCIAGAARAGIDVVTLQVTGVTTGNVPQTADTTFKKTGRVVAVQYQQSLASNVSFNVSTVEDVGVSLMAQPLLTVVSNTTARVVYYPTVVENLNTTGGARATTTEQIVKGDTLRLSVTSVDDGTTNTVTAKILIEN